LIISRVKDGPNEELRKEGDETLLFFFFFIFSGNKKTEKSSTRPPISLIIALSRDAQPTTSYRFIVVDLHEQ
jgi:hypothetical protein